MLAGVLDVGKLGDSPFTQRLYLLHANVVAYQWYSRRSHSTRHLLVYSAFSRWRSLARGSTLSDSSRRGLHTAQPQVLLTPPPATRSFPSRTAARQDMRPPVSDRSQLPSRPPEQDAACVCTHSHYSHGHAHTRRPRHMLMVHEALLPATPTCTHGVSRGSCTPPIPPKAHAPT